MPSSGGSEREVQRLGFRGADGANEERHVGRNVIALLILSVVAAVLLAHIFRLGVPATILSLIVGGGAPASLYMTWESLRQSDKPGGEAGESADVDDLAEIVLKQWEQEYEVRTYGDPAQQRRELTVAWSAVKPPLAVSWESLVERASGRGALKGVRRRNWARGPDGLTGIEHELPGIIEKVPTGWIVVLGGSGSGKTMLLLRTVRDLIDNREKGDPVPVFVSMASWNPRSDNLRTWLEKRLRIDYPGLGAIVSRGGKKATRIEILLDEQLIVPMLDGLDEMPAESQVAAIDRLDEAFLGTKRPLRLVMSCRTDEYREAAGRPEAGRQPLAAAAAIELHALDPDKVSSYLGDRDDPRWSVVDARLKPDGSFLAGALNTPLYASLASAIYNAGRAVARGKLRDPAELCGLRSAKAVHNHLLDEFVPAMYAKQRDAQDRRAEDDEDDEDEADLKPEPGPHAQGGEEIGAPPRLPAERWLMVLADYLTNGRKKHTTNLEWWDLKGLAPRWLVPGIIGIVCGVATAVAAATGTHVGVGIGIGFGTGMLIAIAIGLGVFWLHFRWDKGRVRRGKMDRKEFRDRYKKRRPGPGMAGGMIGAVIGSLAAGVAGKYHIGHEASLFSGLPEGLGMAIGAGASTDFVGGLAGTLVGAFAGGCLAAVGLGLPAGLVNGAGVGLAAALAIVTLGRQAPSDKLPKWDKEIGIPGGLIIGAVVGLIAGREEGVPYGIAFGIILAVLAALPFGLRHRDENLRSVPSPGEALTRDLQAFRLTALSAGLAAGAAGFIGGSMTSIFEVHGKASWSAIVGNGLGIGVAAGLVIGLTFGFYHAASPEFRIISWWLAIRGKAPWRFKRFLDEAYQLSVLRQSGASYQFRHVELQDRLAERFRAEESRRRRPGRNALAEEGSQDPGRAESADAPATSVGPVPDTR
jgi:NACHT domain